MNINRSRLLTVVTMAMLLSVALHAQIDMKLKRVVNLWPEVELYYQAFCEGNDVTKGLDHSNLRLYENGIEIQDFTITCKYGDCAANIMLVYSEDGSAFGGLSYYSYEATQLLLATLDSITDRVGLITYVPSGSKQYSLLTNEFTNINNLAYQYWQNGAFHGHSYANTGLLTAITAMDSVPIDQCNAILIVAEEYNPLLRDTIIQTIVQQAMKKHIRVFIVSPGLFVNSPDYDLSLSISTLTGGVFYNERGKELPFNVLPAIFGEIAQLIKRGFDECRITYTPECPDGTVREVELHYTDYCNGKTETVIRKGTYTAPLDSSAFAYMEYALQKAVVKAKDTVLLPLELISTITKEEHFNPSRFRILFDSNCVTFNGFLDNGLLAGVPYSVTNIPGGVEIYVEDKYSLSAAGILASLSFIASNPYDTTTCVVRLESWVAEAGCFLPVLHNGQITILPDLPIITGRAELPTQLVCTGDSSVYDPNPFTVRFYVYNTGEIEAIDTKVELITDPSVIELVSPLAIIQDAYPPAVLVGDSAYAMWQLRALPRVTGDSIEITALVTFGNHPPVTITRKTWIPPTCAELTCALDASQRTGSGVIDATVSISNLGGETTDSTFATIILPAPLTLFGPDAPDRSTKVLTPEMIAYNSSSTTSWQIDCSLAENKDYTIGVWSWSKNADSVYCETTVAVNLPVAACAIAAVDELTVDDVSYTPNPFDLVYTLTNTGNAELDVTEITIQLPAYITTTDAITQSVSPLAPSAQHDITWSLTALTSAFDRDAVITVIAEDSEGNTLSVCEHHVFIPGVDALSCELIAQGPLVFDKVANEYDPNPFEIVLQLLNDLDSAQTNVEVEVNISSPEISLLNPSSPQLYPVVDAHILKSNNWIYKVNQLVDNQTTVTITYRTRSDQYPDWHECSVDIIIPPREYTYCATCDADGIDTVWSNSTNEIMLPVPFQVYTAVANNCNGDLTDVYCSITLPNEFQLAPGVNQIQRIYHIAPGDTMYAFWDLMATPSASDYSAQVQIEVSSADITSPSICQHTVRIVHRDDIGLAPAKKLVYFTAVQDGNLPAAQDVMVYAGFPTEMPWTASYDTWLDVAPSNSTSSENISIQPNTTSLPYGRYWGAVDFASAHPNAPKRVDVIYDVVDVVSVGNTFATAKGLTLHANYPNPFTGTTTIRYTTETAQPVTLTVYNTLGIPVRVIQRDAQPGESVIQLTGLKPGLYMLVLHGRDGVATRMMLGR